MLVVRKFNGLDTIKLTAYNIQAEASMIICCYVYTVQSLLNPSHIQK